MAVFEQMYSTLKQWRRTRKRRRRWERFKGKGREEIFTTIFKENFWRSAESVSGSGSELQATELARPFIEKLVRELGIRSVLDVPCGDFNWMRQVDLGDCHYTGGDIVRPLIDANQSRYSRAGHDFIHMDITRDAIPRADLILCRDCFIHFSDRHITAALRNFKRSGSTYLLTNTYREWRQNENIRTGEFRHLNLRLPPFNFPPPVRQLDEKSPEEQAQFFGKMLGLWKLADL